MGVGKFGEEELELKRLFGCVRDVEVKKRMKSLRRGEEGSDTVSVSL